MAWPASGSEEFVLLEASRFALQLVDEALDVALHQPAHLVEANAGEAHAELFVVAQVAQLRWGGDGADGHPGSQAFIDLARLQAAAQVAFEAQFAASGGDIQHHALDRCRQAVAVQFDGHQLGLPEGRAEGVAALVIGHFSGQEAPVAAISLELADRGRLPGFPGDAHALVETFHTEGLAVLQETFAVVRDHFVQGDQAAITVHFYQIALESLVAVVEGDDQGIVVLLQQTKIGQDFDRCLEHFGGLWAVIFVEWIGHGPGLSERKSGLHEERRHRACVSVLFF